MRVAEVDRPSGAMAQVEYDMFKNSAVQYTPKELMLLWGEIGRRSIYGRSYVPFFGDARQGRNWDNFVRMRRFFVEEGINPRLYFQAIFDYAVFKRREVRLQTPLGEGCVRSKLWRPWPSLATSQSYVSIYRAWLASGRRCSELTDEKQREILRTLRPQKVRVADTFKQTADLVAQWSTLYPGMRRADVLAIVFRELSPQYLFFMPEAQPLILRGAGNRTQRRVFSDLASSAMLRERYEALYRDVVRRAEVRQKARG